MRAFDDICVRPGFDDESDDRKSTLRRVVATGAIAAVAVGAAVVLVTGKVPEIPGVDAYVLLEFTLTIARSLTGGRTQEQRAVRAKTGWFAGVKAFPFGYRYEVRRDSNWSALC